MIGSPPRQSDDVVVALSRREPERFAEIYQRYFSEIYRYVAGRLGRDIADDLAAETERQGLDPSHYRGMDQPSSQCGPEALEARQTQA